ncbi:MAG: diaminopimelate epimerase [Vampirovibrionales bacterium]
MMSFDVFHDATPVPFTASLIKTLRFYKMHGLGNDFVMVDAMQLPHNTQASLRHPESMAVLSRAVCHRHFGIGADGCILVSQLSDELYPFYLYHNQDGTPGGMCGNGIRCFAHYVMEAGYLKEAKAHHPYTWCCQTPVGEKRLSHLEGDMSPMIQVNMGVPVLEPSLIPFNPESAGTQACTSLAKNAYDITLTAPQVIGHSEAFTLRIQCVSMGNPHGILWYHLLPETLQSSWDTLVTTLGPLLEVHPSFPQKANISFARYHDEHTVSLAVWERGCGPTLACGTGACATVVSGMLQGVLKDDVHVRLPGGSLHIQWHPLNAAPVIMTGTATMVGEVIPHTSFIDQFLY